MRRSTQEEALSEISDDQSSSEWQPEMRVCVIDKDLLRRISGVSPDRFVEVTSLDLHLKDGQLGKIRKIENLHFIHNIEVLNLSYNAITAMEGFDCLTRLVELNLAENAITQIDNIFHLSRLQRLNLSGNRISELPAQMSQLTSLTVLRISRNQITRTENMTALTHLPRLVNLRCDGNPMASNRSVLVYMLPTLTVLDNEAVSAAERAASRDSHDASHLKTLRSSLIAEGAKQTAIASSNHPRSLLGLTRYSSSQSPPSAVLAPPNSVQHHQGAVSPPTAVAERRFVGLATRERRLFETPPKREEDALPPPTSAPSRETRTTPSAGDSRVERLGARIVALEKQKSSVIEENEELRGELMDVQRQLHITQSEVQALRQDNNRLAQTQAVTQSTETALEVRLKRRIEDLEETVSDLTSSYDRARAELQRLKAESTLLEKELADAAEKHQQAVHELTQEKKLVQNNFVEETRAKEQVLRDVETLRQEKENIEADFKQLQAQRNQTEAENALLNSQLHEAELAIKSRDVDIQRLQHEISFCHSAKLQSAAEISNSAERRLVSTAMAPLDVLSGFIRDRLSRSNVRGVDVTSISQQLAHDLMSDTALLQSYPPVPSDSSSDISDVQVGGAAQDDDLNLRLKRHFVNTVDAEEVIYRRREVQTLKDAISELEDVERQIQEKIARSRSTAASIEAETLNARHEAEAALNELESLMRRLAQAKSDLEKVQLQCQSKTSELQSVERTIRDAETYYTEEQHKVETQTQRITSLNKDIIKLQDIISDLSRRRQDESAQYSAMKLKAADDIAVLQSEADGISRTIRDLIQRKQELESHISSSEEKAARQREALEREVLSRRKELEDVNTSIAEATKRLERCRSELERTEDKVRSQEISATQTMQAKSRELAEMDAQLKEKTTRMADLTSECNALENKYKNALQQCANAARDAEETCSSLDQLRQERHQLERSVESKRQSLASELQQANLDIEAAQRKIRQLGIMADQKAAELDSISSEVRVLENRSEEYKRSTKLQEQQLENSRIELQSVNGQISRMKDTIQAQKAEEMEVRLKLQYMKSARDADIRAADECKQRLEILQEKELAVQQSQTQLQAEVTALKHAIDVHRKDLEALRASTDIEKARAGEANEKHTARSLECKQMEDRLLHIKSEFSEEEKRVLAMKHNQQSLKDELSQLQCDIVAAKRHLGDCARQEADYHKRDLSMEQLRRKVQAEVQSLHEYFETEKRHLHVLKADRDAIVLELKEAKEKLISVNAELQESSEAAATQHHHIQQYIAERDTLLQELSDIRRRIDSDSRRSDELATAFRSLDEQLSQIRGEITSAEACFQEARARAAAEEAKAEQCRVAASTTAIELERLEAAIAKSCSAFHDERLRALIDISQLEITRTSLLGNMQMLSESKERANRIAEHNIQLDKASSKTKSRKMNDSTRVPSVESPVVLSENHPPASQRNHEHALWDEMSKLKQATAMILEEDK